jgi:hypothetical protein
LEDWGLNPTLSPLLKRGEMKGGIRWIGRDRRYRWDGNRGMRDWRIIGFMRNFQCYKKVNFI